MTKITRLSQWSMCGCLIGLAYMLPLQARAQVAVQTSAINPSQQLHKNYSNHWNTNCADVVPATQSAAVISATSPACSVALSGPLIASNLSAGSVVTDPSATVATTPTTPAITPLEDMVHQVNRLRASKGLAPLKANPQLATAAQSFATRMGGNNFFSHNDPDNGCVLPWDRMEEAGYINWNFAAENIAAGYNTASSAMDGFINSPSHYNTLVNPKLREIGVGLFNDQVDSNNVRLINSCPSYANMSGPFMFYWVQDFGARYVSGMPLLPIVIDYEAPIAASRDVTVYVYGGEYGQPQWVTQMRFSADGVTWSAFEPYAAQKAITLGRGTGLQTVYAQLKNAAGAVQTISDSIYSVDSTFLMPFNLFMPTLLH